MPTNLACPKCASANVLLSKKKRGVCICEDCGHEFTSNKTTSPLRIFLSYGHDSNEELVRRIKVDLEKRGHDVWFDKSDIKFGDDWRRSITDGIVKSNRVLSFLSKHSTRDPGVCRDEIAIAIGVKGGNIQTILVESEQEVQPPVNIGHVQWLDMHDWKERRAGDEAAWEQWYQEKIDEIVAVVESEESRRFAGEIETLNGHLKPIKSDARISTLLSKGFYGRQWLFEAVEKWRQDRTQDSRLFWIMGAPGVGKSAFAAQLTHTRGDTVIAAQFCEWDKPDHRNAQRVVRSLAFQLATRLPDYRKLLLTLPELAELDRKDAGELFAYLLANPLRSVINGGRERYLIVIDALDEAGEAGRNPLVEMLARNAQRLPDWLGLVVTSRPEFDVKTPLQALNPFPLDTQSESNRADIRDYLRRELAPHLQNRSDADRLVERILEKSEGVFLYVERFCDDVQHGHLSLDRSEQFPQGLGGIFADYFKRQFPDLDKFRKDVRPALRAILAAPEPLPVEILQRLFNWQDEQLRDFTRLLGSLLPVATEADHEDIKPYHKSLADWLADESKAGPYFVSVREGHRMLAEYGWHEHKRGIQRTSSYASRFTSWHYYCAGDYNRLHEFLGLIFPQSKRPLTQDRIHLNKLPLAPLEKEFFRLVGREQELAFLDLAFGQPQTAVIALVAWAGVGKTALVQHWLARLRRSNWCGVQRVYGWNFFTHDSQTSEDNFLSHALEWFGVSCDPKTSPWDKGRLLADVMCREPTLLILDAIESLQYPPGPMGGHLRAPGVQALLRRLAAACDGSENHGLCVVTSRDPLADLADYERRPNKPWASAVRSDLCNLTEEAGAEVLHQLGVCNAGIAKIAHDDAELRAASRALDCHALSLTLLGRFLACEHGGDIRRVDLVNFEEADCMEQGGTIFKLLTTSYKQFTNSGEFGARQLAILRILGLFDHPADAGCIGAFRQLPVIAGLTDSLFNKRHDDHNAVTLLSPLSDEEWDAAVSALSNLGLVSTQAKSGKDLCDWLLDCHPLIRAYFTHQFQRTNPESWLEAKQRVCENTSLV